MSLKNNHCIIDNKKFTIDTYLELKKKNPKSIIFRKKIFNLDNLELEFIESKQKKFRSHFRIKSKKKVHQTQ